MTIEELCNANEDMSEYSVCVIHCRYTNIFNLSCNDIIEARRVRYDNMAKGCIIYDDSYYHMPKVLKDLNVNRFKCLSPSRSVDKPSKWSIWVV